MQRAETGNAERDQPEQEPERTDNYVD